MEIESSHVIVTVLPYLYALLYVFLSSPYLVVYITALGLLFGVSDGSSWTFFISLKFGLGWLLRDSIFLAKEMADLGGFCLADKGLRFFLADHIHLFVFLQRILCLLNHH